MKANTPRHWFMSVRLTWQAAIVQICLKMPDATLNMPRALQKCDSQNIKNNNNNYNKPTINPPAASMKACMNDAVSQCSAQWTWFTGLLWGYNVLINESTAEIQIRFIYCTDYKWHMRLLAARCHSRVHDLFSLFIVSTHSPDICRTALCFSSLNSITWATKCQLIYLVVGLVVE